MPEEAPPRMCISYCHDSPGHQDRLLVLADRLHGEGVGGAETVLRPIRRRRIGLLAAAGAVAGMLLAGPAIADPSPAAAITECDRLAADPDDPNREGPGVALDKIDAPSAIASCGQALVRNPNNPRVMLNLGRANERAGRIDEAARLFKLAADQGLAAAQFHLGVFYQNGAGGLAKDEREAVRLYKLAAEQGDPDAQFNLGIFYELGRGGLTKDERKAASLYKLAAEQGVAFAQFHLGEFYENGRGGLAKDEREAARLYKLAADQGMPEAQFNLAVFYGLGRGGLAKDEREAARLDKLAAEQGFARAQYNLGVFYENGRGGLAKDEGEAARLYRLSAQQGNELAKQNLARLGIR